MTPTPIRITDDRRISESWAARELPGDIVDGRQRVQLIEPLDYRDRTDVAESAILVPAGFITDFASIPFGARNLFPPLGLHARPAIIHDLLYLVKGDLPNLLERLMQPGPPKAAYRPSGYLRPARPMLNDEQITAYLNITQARPELNRRTYTRAQADAVFAEAMAVVGVPAWRRTIMHRAVRMAGGGGWGR